MALDETAEVRMSRPAEEVAAYMFDPANDPTWIGGISEAEPLVATPMGVGSRIRRRARFLGRRIDYVMEVMALDPGRRLAMHAVEAPMPMDVTYEVDPDPDGAIARVRVQGDAGGLYRESVHFSAGWPLDRRRCPPPQRHPRGDCRSGLITPGAGILARVAPAGRQREPR